jgi:hypothetical protein
LPLIGLQPEFSENSDKEVAILRTFVYLYGIVAAISIDMETAAIA